MNAKRIANESTYSDTPNHIVTNYNNNIMKATNRHWTSSKILIFVFLNTCTIYFESTNTKHIPATPPVKHIERILAAVKNNCTVCVRDHLQHIGNLSSHWLDSCWSRQLLDSNLTDKHSPTCQNICRCSPFSQSTSKMILNNPAQPSKFHILHHHRFIFLHIRVLRSHSSIVLLL